MSPRSRSISRRASVSTTSLSARDRSLTSRSRVREPPSAKASAIWRPIRPAPTTATVLMESGISIIEGLGSPPERGSPRTAAINHHHVLAHPAVVVGEADRGVGHLACAGLAAELGEHLRRLRDAGGAQRMAATDEPPAGVDDEVAAVIAPPGGDERSRFALGAE